MGHILQMLVHLVLHIEDYALRYPRIYVAFKHTDNPADSESAEGEDKQPYKQRHIFAYKRMIDDFTCDNRRKQSNRCRQQNRSENKYKLHPVGLKI